LISVVVVVVDSVVNRAPGIRKGGPTEDPTGKLILYPAKETLLRHVVPAIASAGHGLPQGAILQGMDKLHTGVVVAVEARPAVEGGPVGIHQFSHGFQHKIHLKGLTAPVCSSRIWMPQAPLS